MNSKIYLNRSKLKSYLKTLLLVFVILECDSFLSQVLGINKFHSAWLLAGVFCLCCSISLYKVMTLNHGRESRYFFYPLFAFFAFFLVSFISNTLIFPKPIKQWLMSLYVFTSIFLFYFLYVFDYSRDEVMRAIIAVSVLISIILLSDNVMRFEFMDQFQRRSAFFASEVRRIVLLKNELIFGFVIIMSLIISSKSKLFDNKVLICVAGLLFFTQAFIMESRMGFLAMGVACLTLLYLKGVTAKTISIYGVGVISLIFIFPFAFDKHIESLGNMSTTDSQSNISIRFETIEYFYSIFLETYGIGIGMMSSNGKVNNVLHTYEHFNINDAGAFSALFQFGILGLLIWITYTIKCLKAYKSFYSFSNRQDSLSAASFAFMLGFTISLLPFSFFTSYSSISLGGILLYLLYSYRRSLSVNKVKFKSLAHV